MPDDILTLANMLTINSSAVADIDVTDILDDAPFLAALAAIEASAGTQHMYLKETGAPVVGFRAVNAGRDHDVSTDELVTLNLKILDASFHVDKDLADSYVKGGAAAWLAREARRHLRAAFKGAERQIINGLGEDAGGFSGLADVLAVIGDYVLSAGGSTALSSVYMIRTTPDQSNMCVIAGQGGDITIADSFVQFIADESDKKFPAYMTPISGWLGLQIGSASSVARLANLDASGHTLTDDLLSDLFGCFPEGREPTHILMNKRSRKQLQQSRTATNATGAPAPWPVEWEGVPIISTSSIGIAETVVNEAGS